MNRDELRVLNSLERGQTMTAEVTASGSSRYAFIGVYPLDTSMEQTQNFLKSRGQFVPPPEFKAYHIRRFEVLKELVDRDLSLGESNLDEKRSWFAYGEKQLAEKLLEAGVPMGDLKPSFRTRYPI